MVIHVFMVLLAIFNHIKVFLKKKSCADCLQSPISSFQVQGYGLIG